MDPGYQMEPESIGRTRSRRLPTLVGMTALALVVLIAKPWAGPDGRTTGPAPTSADLAASSSRPTATSYATPIADPGWPVPDWSRTGATLASTQAEGALASLEGRRGTWGVGATGSGPRLIRDDTWSDWTSVEPEVVTGAAVQDEMPRHILIWPGSGLCTGLQAINERPTVIAVTLPATIKPGPAVGDGWRGWWTDGGRTASIDDSVRTVPTGDRSGIVAIERIDGAPWPVGLYEFQLRVADRIFDMAVCMTRRD